MIVRLSNAVVISEVQHRVDERLDNWRSVLAKAKASRICNRLKTVLISDGQINLQ